MTSLFFIVYFCKEKLILLRSTLSEVSYKLTFLVFCFTSYFYVFLYRILRNLRFGLSFSEILGWKGLSPALQFYGEKSSSRFTNSFVEGGFCPLCPPLLPYCGVRLLVYGCGKEFLNKSIFKVISLLSGSQEREPGPSPSRCCPVTRSCPTLRNPRHCSQPGSLSWDSGVLEYPRILECVAMPSF